MWRFFLKFLDEVIAKKNNPLMHLDKPPRMPLEIYTERFSRSFSGKYSESSLQAISKEFAPGILAENLLQRQSETFSWNSKGNFRGFFKKLHWFSQYSYINFFGNSYRASFGNLSRDCIRNFHKDSFRKPLHRFPQ